jgi:hypothetical protein
MSRSRAGRSACAVVIAAVGIVLAAAGMVLAVVGPALAHHSDIADEADTRGVLDVRAVLHGHDRAPRTWEVVTYARWTARQIWDAGYVLVWLDTIGDEAPDYYALARSTGRRRRMSGSLFHDRDRRDVFVSKLDTRRRNQRSITIEVPFHRMSVGRHRTSYRWSAETILNGGPCPRSCFDYIPNGGAQVEEPYDPSP